MNQVKKALVIRYMMPLLFFTLFPLFSPLFAPCSLSLPFAHLFYPPNALVHSKCAMFGVVVVVVSVAIAYQLYPGSQQYQHIPNPLLLHIETCLREPYQNEHLHIHLLCGLLVK